MLNPLHETIIDSLQGSCQSLTQVLADNDASPLQDDKEFLAELDSRIFCCTQCDWWCETSEQSDDGERCDDCNSDEVDE